MTIKNIFKILIVSIFLFTGGSAFAGTFGWQGGDLNAVEFMEDELMGSEFTLTESNVQVQSMSAYIEFIGNGQIKAGIYDSNEDLVAETLPYTNSSGALPDAWFDFTFDTKPTLDSGVYWLIITANNGNSLIHVEDGSSQGTYWSTSTFNGFPATFDDPQLETNRGVGIIATYRTPYITIQSTFATSVLAYAGDLFTDLNTIIVLVIGIPVAFWVSDKIIGLFIKDNGKY